MMRCLPGACTALSAALMAARHSRASWAGFGYDLAVHEGLATTAHLKWAGPPGVKIGGSFQHQTDITQGVDPTAGGAKLYELHGVFSRSTITVFLRAGSRSFTACFFYKDASFSHIEEVAPNTWQKNHRHMVDNDSHLQ